MNQFKEVAVIGSGKQGSLFVASLLAKLPPDSKLIVYFQSENSAMRAASRIKEALAQLEHFDHCFKKLCVDFSGCVDKKTDLVLEQLPASSNRAKLRSAYCKELTEDIPVLSYSSTFPEELAQDICGYFHYSNPAHILPLLELGIPNQDDLATFFTKLGFHTLFSRRWLPGFFSTRVQTVLLESACKFYETPKDADLIDRTVAYYARKVFSDLIANQELSLNEAMFKIEMPRIAEANMVQEVTKELFKCLKGLEEFWTPKQIAQALCYGPGIRFIDPGFLRFVDMEGIIPFLKVMVEVNPDADTRVLERLMKVGRTGGSTSNLVIDNGFHNWSLDQRSKLKSKSDEFLRTRFQNT